jgi:hypothetical protein
MDGLALGKDVIPQYAGTKQKVANVLVEMDDGSRSASAELMELPDLR